MALLMKSRLCMLLLLIFLLNQTKSENCNYFKGSWILDSSYPLYDSTVCPFVQREFGCKKNGRPDTMFAKYRWQPHDCILESFNGTNFLKKLKGKSIMFIGDSLSKNQWESLSCILYNAVPNVNYTMSREDQVSTLTFTDFGVKVMLDRTNLLVDIVNGTVNGTKGRILRLESVEQGMKIWKGIDTLIFNTWQWWYRRGSGQPWEYVQVGKQILKDIDRMDAFERALRTWAAWVNSTINPAKTKIFFQGISPSHYNGSEWNEPGVKTCLGQTKPIGGSIYLGGSPRSLSVLKKVLKTVKKSVTLLDITNLSQLRKDGHPSIYGQNGKTGMDCTHWCLAGVPDAWNEILYNFLL